MKKNQTVEVTIEDIGINGEGIGKYDGYPLFIKDAIVGDRIEALITKASKNYGYARLSRIITPSPDRVEARCRQARTCGGCQLQELSYDRQLFFKEKKVRDSLRRIGGFDEAVLDRVFEPIMGMDDPWYYRNKAQVPVGYDRSGKLVAGFFAGRTHQIIPMEGCVINMPGSDAVINKVLNYMQANRITAYDETSGKGTVRHILLRYGFFSGQWMVCLVINDPSGEKLRNSDQLIESLREIPGMTSISFSPNTRNTNVIMGETYKTIWGEPCIHDTIGDLEYEISPLSFYQVNPKQTKVLYETALAYAGLTGNETVWDLYCGIGTISLFLARNAARVYGVEVVPQAIEDAKRNAALNRIENTEFICGRAEEVLPARFAETGERADVIVVDPPRKGCDEVLLETITRMAPDRVVYVSCDSATLARDLKYLAANGYRLEKVRPCDQFSHTAHVEVVVMLSRTEGESGTSL